MARFSISKSINGRVGNYRRKTSWAMMYWLLTVQIALFLSVPDADAYLPSENYLESLITGRCEA